MKNIYDDETKIKVSELMYNLDKDGIPKDSKYTRLQVIEAIEKTKG